MDDDVNRFADEWEALVRHVRREASELVLLPEMPFYGWFAMSPMFDKSIWNEAVATHGKWMKRLVELAPAMVIGTRPINRKGRRFNEGFVWTKGRGTSGVHLKSYLPDEEGYYEASWYDRGDRKFSAFGTSRCRVGLLICSELWAMQHARTYGMEGAHLIAVPHAAPMSSIEKWIAGGKVAAVISGAFCIASNRTGERKGIKFGGSGWIIDPDANVLGLTSEERPFVTADIDRRKAEAAKKTYPRDTLRPD